MCEIPFLRAEPFGQPNTGGLTCVGLTAVLLRRVFSWLGMAPVPNSWNERIRTKEMIRINLASILSTFVKLCTTESIYLLRNVKMAQMSVNTTLRFDDHTNRYCIWSRVKKTCEAGQDLQAVFYLITKNAQVILRSSRYRRALGSISVWWEWSFSPSS